MARKGQGVAQGRLDADGRRTRTWRRSKAIRVLRSCCRRRATFENPFVEPVKILREWDGEAANDQFGWIARNIGDVDGDGVADMVTSAPTSNGGGEWPAASTCIRPKRESCCGRRTAHAGDQLGTRRRGRGRRQSRRDSGCDRERARRRIRESLFGTRRPRAADGEGREHGRPVRPARVGGGRREWRRVRRRDRRRAGQQRRRQRRRPRVRFFGQGRQDASDAHRRARGRRIRQRGGGFRGRRSTCC